LYVAFGDSLFVAFGDWLFVAFGDALFVAVGGGVPHPAYLYCVNSTSTGNAPFAS
jgi:hypothetical protein